MADTSSEDELDHVPVKKAKKSRGRVWSDDETRCLIEAWKKYERKSKDIGSKQPFKEKIVKCLKEGGFDGRDAKQVGKRMENLRHEFRNKAHPKTGSEGGVWKWREELCDLLRDDFHTPDPTKFKQSSTPATSSSSSATIATISDDESVASGISGSAAVVGPVVSPISAVRSQKRAKQKPEKDNTKMLELYEREVLAKKEMAKQAAEMVKNQNLLLAALTARMQQAPSAMPAVSPQPYRQPYQSVCGNCGNCNYGQTYHHM